MIPFFTVSLLFSGVIIIILFFPGIIIIIPLFTVYL